MMKMKQMAVVDSSTELVAYSVGSSGASAAGVELGLDDPYYPGRAGGESASRGPSVRRPTFDTLSVPTGAPRSLPASSPSPFVQMRALLWKNAKVKSRTCGTTFCEIFSPVLMMVALVFAYGLSTVTHVNPHLFSTFRLDIPGPLLDIYTLYDPTFPSYYNLVKSPAVSCAIELQMYCAGTDVNENISAKGDISQESRDCLWSAGETTPLAEPCRLALSYWYPKKKKKKSAEQGDAGEDNAQAKPTDDDDVSGTQTDDGNDDDGGGGGPGNVGGSILNSRAAFNKLLRGPLPVPTFDEYVSVGYALKNSIDDPTFNELLNNNDYGRMWGNIFTLGTLHFAPSGKLADDLVQYLKDSTNRFANVTHRIHDSSDDAIRYINDNINERAFVLVELDDSSLDPDDISFVIRMNYTTLPNTRRVTDWISLGLNEDYQKYYLSGFLTIQRTLADFVFNRTQCSEVTPLPPHRDLFALPMPTAAFDANIFYTAVGYLLGLAIAMGFLYPMSRLVKAVVEEKEQRMKETMLILGLNPFVHWLSWVITAYTTFTLIAILVTWVISHTFLPQSSRILLFMYIWLFCTSVVGFSFFVASFFSRPKLAAIIGPIALFTSLMPRWVFYGSNRYEGVESKAYASLLPCTAFAFGADILSDYEYKGVGIQRYNMYEGAYSFSTCLGMMFFDSLFYFALAWYTEQVMPSQFGVQRKFYFLLMPSYWRGVINCFTRGAFTRGSKPEVYLAVDEERTNDRNLEPIGLGFTPTVQIRNLVKKYSGAEKRAVDNLSLSMYESQITCLLGHNGAGKTSTIALLTGLYPPTSGDAVIYGNSIAGDMNACRLSMGICPQHNVLFAELTVAEHIYFFSRIKGKTPSRAEIAAAASDVGLADKLDTLSGALSGGMKRKLSVAISLCGDPKFLLLDEPTSGMDPFSRRATWELLRRNRAGRVTLLTTHFMDEAEILSDRIAVMKQGKLQCVGSSLFLKKRFGLGYNITFVSSEASEATAIAISSFLRRHVPDAEVINVSGREISFRLPAGSEVLFPALFDEFEKGGIRESLGIGGYGVSNTTLEEVFIRLADEQDSSGSSAVLPNGGMELKGTTATVYDGKVKAASTELIEIGFSPSGTPQSTPRSNPLRAGESRDNGRSEIPALAPSKFSTMLSSLRPLPVLPKRAERNNPTQPVDDDMGFNTEGFENFSKDAQNAASFEPSSFKKQVLVLLRKRYIVQRRDLKSTFFLIALPALIVALVLAILTVEIPLAGPTLFLSADLYTYSNSRRFKTPARTNILGGGGASSNISGDASAAFDALQSAVMADGSRESGRMDWDYVEGAQTSTDLSFVLLDEMNSHSHALRYGAYVFDDSIPVRAAVDWLRIAFQIDESSPGDGGELPFDGDYTAMLEIVTGPKDEGGYYSYSFSSDQFEYIVENVLGFEASDSFKVKDLINTTETYLHELLLSNVTQRLEEQDPPGGYDIGAISDEDIDAAVEYAFESFAGDSKNITIQDVFDAFEELTGADEDAGVLGWVTIKTTAVSVNSTSRVVTMSDVVVITGGGEGGKGADGVAIDYGDIAFTIPKDWKQRILNQIPEENKVYMTQVNNTHTIVFNSTSPHALASFTQSLFESIYRQCPFVSDTAKFRVANHPLPLTVTQSIEIQTILSLFASLFVLIPFCYMPASFTVFVVRERVCKSKHLQLVSGVKVTAFWCSTLLFDVALFTILTLFIMMAFLLYGSDSARVFVGSADSLLCTVLLTFLYGTSSLPFAYILSRSFKNYTTAQISIMGIFFITGFMFVTSFFIMSAIPTTEDAAKKMVHFFRFFPAYNVGEGLIRLSASYFYRTILRLDTHPFDYDVCGMNLSNMFFLSIGYTFVLLILELSDVGGGGGVTGSVVRAVTTGMERFGFWLWGVRVGDDGKLNLNDGLDGGDNDGDGGRDDDEDVGKEKEQVEKMGAMERERSVILLDNLWKVYPPTLGVRAMMKGLATGILFPLIAVHRLIANVGKRTKGPVAANLPKRAVRGLTLSIPAGECFGLLGVNGAGKTTTLGILTGEIHASAGGAYVVGYDVGTGTGLTEARKRIGFCPQEDPLLDLMTGRETLRMFAQLRGMKEVALEDVITSLLSALGLTPHADKCAGAYSGGNKRKLSLGVALIGDPAVLFIDEASSGMDPVARRKMWDLLSHLSKNRTVVLTTHSMEEAEALCTRLAIMVSGRMRCLGSCQHLKARFLGGYNVDVHCAYDAQEKDVDAVRDHICNVAIPGARVEERHGRFLKFKTPGGSGEAGIGVMFARLQEMKIGGRFTVLDYSIMQASLEQVFISLAKVGDGAACGAGGGGDE